MEAKELRIGNYLEYFIETDNLGWQPTKIDWQDLKRLSEQPESFSKEHRFVTLTEEWLIKFGFELDEDLGDMKYYQMPKVKRGFGVCFDHEEIAFYLFNIKGIVNLIYDESFLQHVHQFQNLYFALTNEELEINL